VPTSAVPTSATGKIAAGGLEHIVAPHLQRNKHVDYELTTSRRSRAVSTVKAANASSRHASSQTRGWHRERARPTTSRSREIADKNIYLSCSVERDRLLVGPSPTAASAHLLPRSR
jgi:hypothetical protein